MPGPTGPDARILARVWELWTQDKTRQYIALTIAEEFPEQWDKPPSLATITNWVRDAHRHAMAAGVLDHEVERARHLDILSAMMCALGVRHRDHGVHIEVLWRPMLAILQERAKVQGFYAPTRLQVEGATPEFDRDLLAALGVENNDKLRALESAERD